MRIYTYRRSTGRPGRRACGEDRRSKEETRPGDLTEVELSCCVSHRPVLLTVYTSQSSTTLCIRRANNTTCVGSPSPSIRCRFVPTRQMTLNQHKRGLHTVLALLLGGCCVTFGAGRLDWPGSPMPMPATRHATGCTLAASAPDGFEHGPCLLTDENDTTIYQTNTTCFQCQAACLQRKVCCHTTTARVGTTTHVHRHAS